MKKIALCLMMLVFSAGFMTQAAFAFSCPYASEMAGSMMDSDMPCHDEEQQERGHCDGICLCQHFSVNQVFDLQNYTFLNTPPLHTAHILALDGAPSSAQKTSLFRPPIFIS